MSEHNFRFNKCLQYIKKKVNLDKVFYIEAESSSYLPNWRKGVDYKKNYSAFAAKGGGVLLDMSHEIDYINWLFKSFKITKIYKNRISKLNILSEDIALIFGLVVLVSSCSTEPKPNPNLEGSVQDFDVCVRKQKAKGLSTDKCWDML